MQTSSNRSVLGLLHGEDSQGLAALRDFGPASDRLGS
jgi:hypothetical protein